MTQAEVARAIGQKDPRIYGRWERGEATPRKDNQIKLAEAFGCEVEEFYVNYEEEFRTNATTMLVNLYKKNILSEDPKLQRIAVAIFQHMFPNPLEIKADVTVSESEEADADLLEEGTEPDVEM